MVIYRWMKGAKPRPTESGRFRPQRQNRRDQELKAGVYEILVGMKGWRPFALRKGSKPDWAF
jgi:hypothetical protein